MRAMAKFIVPLITSYYEYYEIEADTPEEAVEKVKDGDGEEYCDPEWREVIAVGEDAGIIERVEDFDAD
jgi:hypothetical protein